MLIGAGTRPLPAPNPTPTPREGLAGPDEPPERRRICARIQVSTISSDSHQATRPVTGFQSGGTEPDRRTEAIGHIAKPVQRYGYVDLSSRSPTDSTDEANFLSVSRGLLRVPHRV